MEPTDPLSFEDRLLAVQTDLKAPKDKINDFAKYKYRKAEDILENAKPLLAAHGLLLTVSDEIMEVGGRVYVRAAATITGGGQAITVTAYAREQADKKGLDEAQITGSASSYARKYALSGLFLLDDSEADPDTNEYHTQTHQPAQKEEPKRIDFNKLPPVNKQPAPAPQPARAPGPAPSTAQMNYARSLWKQLGNTVVGPDGGDHHDAKTLDYHCQMMFKRDFAAIDKNQMRNLIDNLLGQISAGKKGA